MVDISFKPISSILQIREIKKGDKPKKDRQQEKKQDEENPPPKKGGIDIKA